jgi:hypothetical protein
MKNEEHEQLLTKYRNMLKHPETDYKKLCVSISSKSISLRQSAMKRNIQNIIDGLRTDVVSKKNTPPAVSKLTSISNLWDEIGYTAPRDINNITRKELEKKQQQFLKLNKLIVDFEIDLRYTFENAEALLNALILNMDKIISFNNVIDAAYNNRILTFDELNILKSFNHIRNLFAHNVSYYILIESLTREDIILYKAILLEMRDVICSLMDKYGHRLLTFSVYMISTNEKRKMDSDKILLTYEESLLFALRQEKEHLIKLSLLSLEGLPDGLNVKIKDLKQNK